MSLLQLKISPSVELDQFDFLSDNYQRAMLLGMYTK
jgi:hypothetical protein